MRRPRLIVTGARYHVVARVNRREFILRTRETKDMLLHTISRARKRYRFTVDTLCIMSNHVHFLIRPHGGESLSRIMQWILSVFAVRFNRRFQLVGHVWYDRFGSAVIATFSQFARAYRYIRDNPCRAGLVGDAAYYPDGARQLRRRNPYGAIGPPSLYVRLLFPEDCVHVELSEP